MLPPTHLRQGSLMLARQHQHHTLTSHALRASSTSLLAHNNAQPRRSFWGWRRGNDWVSQLDPLYHRFCRVRTLKTRAKLLRKLQRRGKFEWDNGSVGDFFTPKHVRWATRWDGCGSGRRGGWYLADDGTIKSRKEKDVEEGVKSDGEEGGYELSHREKVWKEQMEAMRRRIESDPYEAIFGKRFEPFWSPLVPSWMREEMGLPVWSKAKDSSKEAEAMKTPEKVEKVPETAKSIPPNPIPQPPKKEAEEKKVEPSKPQPEAQKPASYAYASSTSWDSWTNKTKRVEWDSVSGQTKKYEYDPISNRMVLVTSPPAATAPSLEGKIEPAPKTESTPPTTEHKVNLKQEQSDGAVNIPIKQSTDLRKSIPIPPPLCQPSHSIPIGFTPAPMSVGIVKNAATAIALEAVKKSTAISSDVPKPSALAKIEKQIQQEAEKPQEKAKEKDVESLTADNIRASMGKTKQPSTTETSSVQTQVDALLSESRNSNAARRSTVANDLLARSELEGLYKKKEKLQNDERRLFHIERQKRELQKLDQRIKEVTGRVERLGEPAAAEAKVEKAAVGLQSSLERMQSRNLPKKTKVVEEETQDADDAAAHESTEPIEVAIGSAVPKDWAKQAELLQADRVRRLSARSAAGKDIDRTWTPVVKPRQALTSKGEGVARLMDLQNELAKSVNEQHDAEARRSAHAARRAADEAKAAEEIARIGQEKKRIEREKKLEKANAMLESEVAEQKFRMQAHENRYAHKIRALRQELETAYKQSTVHSEKHLERIRYLEAELAKAVKATGGQGKGAETSQAQGDLARGVTKWYQQSTSASASAPKAIMEKAEQKKRDKELVKEIREIYERRYGVIDTQHQQTGTQTQPTKEKIAATVKPPQVVEVESDVDLGEALAKYENEKQQRYIYLKDDVSAQQMEVSERLKEVKALEKEMQAKEREANEGVKLVDDKVPKLIPTELAATKPAPATEPAPTPAEKEKEVTVRWAEPPLYKVLAYDSGNDFLSTATTTSNFTGVKEEPISIPEALSQLYAPARFVGSFAELQKEGYQVIFGTKDLLVFRKVAGAPTAVAAEIERKMEVPALEDHGLVAGTNHPDHWAAWPVESYLQASEEMARREVNPIDGTSSNVAPTMESTRDLRELTTTIAESADPARNKSVDADFDIRHYPRVKREEYPVFTGTRRRWNSTGEQESEQVERKSRKERRKEHKERSHRRRATWRRAIGVGLGAAGVMYVVGAAAEKSRATERKGEDWARKAEEARRDWRREGW